MSRSSSKLRFLHLGPDAVDGNFDGADPLCLRADLLRACRVATEAVDRRSQRLVDGDLRLFVVSEHLDVPAFVAAAAMAIAAVTGRRRNARADTDSERSDGYRDNPHREDRAPSILSVQGRGSLGGELAAPSSDPFSPHSETCGVHKTRSAQERQLRTAALFGRRRGSALTGLDFPRAHG
jgi:hypothetical protein